MTTYPPPWIDPATGEDDEETLFAMTRAKEEQPQSPAQATGGTAPYPVIDCEDCIHHMPQVRNDGARCWWEYYCHLADRRVIQLRDRELHPEWCPLKKNEGRPADCSGGHTDVEGTRK
jgi:hypothetical protein